MVDGMQLGHAIGRAQIFVAQDHDHMIGKPDALHKPEISSPERSTTAVAENMPVMLSERLTEPIDDFRAFPCVF